MMTLSILFSIAYAYLLITYRRAWRALPELKWPEGFEPKSTITVLIPARNEAENIGPCLSSILDGSYPPDLLEIIVIDDFSEDKTIQVVQQLSESLELSESSISSIRLADQLPPEARFRPNKKKALELGIARASGEIIVTTDADCIVPKDWLMHIVHSFENPYTKMVCAPVAFHQEKNLFERFQSLDLLGLMGISGAGYQLGWHALANGANLAFRKSVFKAVNGYADSEHLASGDDMFLVQKVTARWPGSVVFIKNRAATVLTKATPGWRAFWQQRLRWGTKNAAIPCWPLRLSLLAVFLFCWSIWLNLALAFYPATDGIIANTFWILLFQILVKALCDYFFLSKICQYFNRKDLMRWFLPSFFLHTAYIALVGTASLFFKKFEWKGRISR
ncbi:MAG: glycosyltransferase [Saprospiraceae bacterium]